MFTPRNVGRWLSVLLFYLMAGAVGSATAVAVVFTLSLVIRSADVRTFIICMIMVCPLSCFLLAWLWSRWPYVHRR